MANSIALIFCFYALYHQCWRTVGAQTQRLDITEGQIAPIPVAIAEFTGPDGLPSEVGRQISQIISDDLVSSGLFSAVDSAAFIKPPESPSIRPNFSNWSPLGAKGLLVGSAFLDADGLLQIEFVLWDIVSQRNITEAVSYTHLTLPTIYSV